MLHYPILKVYQITAVSNFKKIYILNVQTVVTRSYLELEEINKR